MEKPIFPMEYMRITQGYQEGTHVDSYAIDNAGKDENIDSVFAPFTGIIKKIYQNDANEVWLESQDTVEYPDGTIDYMTIMFAHANDVNDLFVGKTIKRGEIFYKEGTKGNSTGNHCHIECGLGKFKDNGWHKNNGGYWSINNSKKPEECLWCDDNTKVIESYSYNFKKISTNIVNKNNDSDKEKSTEIVEKGISFIAPKTDLYGVYLKQNQELIIKPIPKKTQETS